VHGVDDREVTAGDDVPNIGSSQQFEAVVEPLNNIGDVGAQAGVKGGFAIPMLIDKKEPRIPDFEEVKSKVAEAVKRERAKEQLAQTARDIASSVKSPADIKAAAEKGFEIETEGAFKPGGTLGKAGASPALDEVVYSLKTGEVSKTPLKVGDNWVVLGVTNRKEADLAEFAQQRDQLMQTMLSARQNQVFEDYVVTVQRRMMQAGKIKIYQDVLASIDEAEPEIATPPGTQIPIPVK